MTIVKLSLKDFKRSNCVECDGSKLSCKACNGNDLIYYINLKTANKAFFEASKRVEKKKFLKGRQE